MYEGPIPNRFKHKQVLGSGRPLAVGRLGARRGDPRRRGEDVLELVERVDDLGDDLEVLIAASGALGACPVSLDALDLRSAAAQRLGRLGEAALDLATRVYIYVRILPVKINVP